MRKVLEICLAVALLCSGAFAAFIQNPIPPSSKQNFFRDTDGDGRMDRIVVRFLGAISQDYIDEKIEQYIADLVFATRYPERYGFNELKDMITFGGSPRASINLAKAARAYAFIKRRGYVVPEDVRAVAHDVLRHRIGLSYEAEAGNVTSEQIVSQIINKVEVP